MLNDLRELANRCKWICINILKATRISDLYIRYGMIGRQMFRISGGVFQDHPCEMYCTCEFQRHVLVCTAFDQDGNSYSIRTCARPTDLVFDEDENETMSYATPVPIKSESKPEYKQSTFFIPKAKKPDLACFS